jgi:hypothetical protein
MALSLTVEHIQFEEHPLAHRRIKSLHGRSGQMQWQHAQDQAIANIQSRFFDYHFFKDGRAVRIVLGRMADGEFFLKSETDSDLPETLLKLPHLENSQPAISRE